MEKTFCLTICLLMAIMAIAQPQLGYVKTKGRLGTNGTVIAGTRISGATITVKGGNAVVSGHKGAFSLAISGNNYYLQNVQKQGYVLTDPDVLSKQYAYSKNPLVLVLEDKEQQKADMRAIERKISSNLYSQLQKRSDELETLKEKNQITEEKYRELLQKINHDQEDNEKLISEMADRYSKMDFDEADEFNRRISQFILEGKLTEADSLLNTKGDINSRTVILRQHQEANAQEERELVKRQKKLEKSKAMTWKGLEDLAQDCYRKHEIFKMQHKNDSAAYYLEFRSELDTTNLQWQNEAGKFLDEYLANYPKALSYYQRVLRQSIGEEGNESPWTAIANSNIGLIYSCLGDYSKALEYFDKALLVQEKIFGSNHPDMAIFYNNIGAAYYYQTNYEMALDYYNQALSLQEKVFGTEHSQVATSYNNIGLLYYCLEDYPKALEYYGKSLAIRETLFGTEHLEVAESYNNIGGLYCNLGDYSKALEYYKKALLIKKRLLGREHPNVAITYNNIGVIYSRQGDYSKALEYYNKAMSIDFRVFGPEHPNVAFSYCNIGNVKIKQGNYQEALENYGKALDIQEKFYGVEHPNTIQVKSKIKEVQSMITE